MDRIRRDSAVILAFDGLLVDTLGLRADAVETMLRTEGIVVTRSDVLRALPGRSLFETVESLAGPADQTRADLVTIQAQLRVSTRMAQGVDIVPAAAAWLQSLRSVGARVVLRADSVRRDVERVLQLSELEHAFAVVRCADDLPRLTGASSLDGSYAAITARLDRLLVSAERTACEVDPYGVATASRHVLRATLWRLPLGDLAH